VTFTQDTWEHIYAVKDKKYASERIVGWYHSHPGFGIFLSEHDTFIHKNFFSSPGQIAWVYDPHSDEEGCFGWVDERLERLSRVAILDRRGGEPAEPTASLEPGATGGRTALPTANGDHFGGRIAVRVRPVDVEGEWDEDKGSLEQLVTKVLLFLATLALGGMLSWYFLPHLLVMPVLIDPVTGKPVDPQAAQILEELQADRAGKAAPANPGQSVVHNGNEKNGSDSRAK
jgi:hypothetical protein